MQLEKDYCIKMARKYHDRFVEKLPDVDLKGAGVFPSEMLLFVSLCLEQGVDLVVESGRRYGYSTRIFAEYDEWSLVSIDREILKDVDTDIRSRYPKAELVKGNGVRLVPHYIQQGRRVAVLLDGPKGQPAFDVGEKVKPSVVFYAVHDLHPWNEGDDKPGTSRQLAAGRGGFLSDDPEYLAEFAYMDEPMWRIGGYTSREEVAKVAFTLGLFPGSNWRQE